MVRSGRRLISAAFGLAAAGALAACGTSSSGSTEQVSAASKEEATIGVNSFLWRAALDTLSFMPLTQVDAFGGVIITDWHSEPSTPNERFRATVYILDTRLRADALNVSIFRQERRANGWTDASVDPETEIRIEDAILQRARQLRLSTLHK
jgi:Domain of unknown function (DUF3576)